MEKDKFESLIRSLEAFAAKNPGAYKLRVALLAALGYVYLLVVVLSLLAIIAVTLLYLRFNWLLLKFLWIPLVIVGIVLRSLWVTIPEPDGAELRREQAPELFDLIHEVTTVLNGPKVHHVLVSNDFNAGIVQIPRFGMFGWLNNYLILGLPYLRTLSARQFQATLAHEVGHLSRKHGSFTGWMYRVRQSWVEIQMRVKAERSYASFLFEPFLNWYAPYLDAYSFILARAQELQADVDAVELAGKDVAATRLVRVVVKHRQLSENFWPTFFRQSREQPTAPRDPFEQLLNGLDQPVAPRKAQKWFYDALRVPTGYDDTHPALADRLAAIGFEKDSPALADLLDAALHADEHQQSAAAYYLHELPEDFLLRQNRLLREELVRPWNESHAKSNEAKRQLAKLDADANIRALTLDEQWERAALLSEVQDNNATIPVLRTILEQDPDHFGAHLALGSILIEQEDANGVAHLEKAMQLNPQTTGEACESLAGFYFQDGEKELAETFRKRAVDHYQKEQKRNEQALSFSERDKFVPHDLSDVIVKNIQSQLHKVRGLNEAFLFRKVLEDSDCVYVFAFLAGYTWIEGQSDKHLEPLFEDLITVTALPAPTVFLPLDLSEDALLPRIRAISGAAIYAR